MSKRTMQTRSMKRSEEEPKDQVERVKRSKIQAAEESAPELNPFLVEPVLVKLLKLVEKVSQLKELRKMSQIWDEFSLKELEDRAFNGKLKAINFSYSLKVRAEERLVKFLEDTQAIPRLFSSFKINFPESWIIFSKHSPGFFSIYPVTFVYLLIPNYLSQERIRALLAKFFETEIWRNFKKISVLSTSGDDREFGFPDSSIFIPTTGNDERKLKLLDIEKYISPEILSVFESLFDSGRYNYNNFTSLGIAKLENGILNFPGLDTSKLTELWISKIEHSSPALKFTSDLIKLARNGMKLKDFGLGIVLTPKRILDHNLDENFFDNLPFICSNLTQFFSSQSSTLETFFFKFICFMKDPREDVPENPAIWCKIHLPKFEVLHSLILDVDFQLFGATREIIHTKIFGMTQNLPSHFPKLIKLTLEEYMSLDALRVNPAPDEAGQLHLKYLEVYDNLKLKYWQWPTSFEGVIASVEELKCPSNLLVYQSLPWGDSLRSLHIYYLNGSFEWTLKLGHFKKLERLLAMHYNSKALVYNRPIDVFREGWSREAKANYLPMFQEAIDLPLKSITFIGRNMEEETKREYIQYFPFPVVFTYEKY